MSEVSAFFRLPETGAGNPPAFSDAAGCKAWLATLPIANAAQSQALLLRQLDLLNAFSLTTAERLRIAELLRDPITACQEGSVKRFAGKPLPLGPAEAAGFESTHLLWQALATTYLHCLAATLASPDDPRGQAQLALLAQRILATMSAARIDALQGGHLPSAESWRVAVGVFLAAERRNSATLEVEDRIRYGHAPTTAAAGFAEIVLIRLAAPHEFGPRQLGWVFRWARRWAGKVRVLPEPPSEAKSPPLCVDLGADDVPGRDAAHSSAPRWLDIGDLRSSVKKRLIKLAAGELPAAIGLGEDCVMPAAEMVLRHVYQHWCKGEGGRRRERQSATGACRLVGGFEAIHAHLSGKAFVQPTQGAALSRQQHEEIATFGRIASHHLEEQQTREPIVEEWTVAEEWRDADEGSRGLIVLRPPAQAGVRLSAGQLVALRPDGASQILLGILRWVYSDGEDTLRASVQSLPGFPAPAAVRGTGLAAINDKYRTAFFLPEVPVLRQPQRIVLPPGMFRTGLVLEVRGDPPRQCRLVELRERGSDFDCATWQ